MSTVPTRAGARQWLGLSVLLLPTMLLFLAMTVLFLATPYITADLKPSSGQVLWINDIYGFIMAGFLVTMGTLGDRFGRRRILLSGAAVFSAASILSAYAPNPDVLIAGRALMGLGAAALVPATLALITNTFVDARQRSVAIGLWAASVSAGVALGPLIGGLLLESLWWGASLLIGVPVMVLVLIATPFLIPEYRAPGAGRLDPLSVALSLAALLPFVFGVKKLAETGVDVTSAATLLAGIGFGAVFVWRQLRLAEPLIDIRLFRDRTFGGALAVYMFAAVALGGVYLLFTQYLQLVAEQSPLAAGLWILPSAVLLVVVSIVTPILARRVRPVHLIAGGMVLSTVGYLVLTQVDSTAGLPLLITGFYILYPGIAPAMALIPDLVISSAPPEKAGAASAVEGTVSDLGIALGVAILGSVGTMAYQSHMDTVEVPAEQAAEASRTLPGALSAAEELPGAAGDALVEAAKTAFTEGLNTAALVAAVLTVIGTAIAVVALRRHGQEPRTTPDETGAEPELTTVA